MDPERFPDDTREPMAKLGMGAVYLSCQDGSALRRSSFSAVERDALMDSLYWPYHHALEQLVEQQLRMPGCCIIVDQHSYPKKGHPYEDSRLVRPAVCIGFDAFHCDEVLRDRWSARIRKEGLDVGLNVPFSGSLVPSRFFESDDRVRSLMIEIRRDLYMDEESGHKSSGFEETSALVQALLALAAERCSELSRLG
jgi:N-formylglutamate amidohydrolase